MPQANVNKFKYHFYCYLNTIKFSLRFKVQSIEGFKNSNDGTEEIDKTFQRHSGFACFLSIKCNEMLKNVCAFRGVTFFVCVNWKNRFA